MPLLNRLWAKSFGSHGEPALETPILSFLYPTTTLPRPQMGSYMVELPGKVRKPALAWLPIRKSLAF